jgi:hypothetical protein
MTTDAATPRGGDDDGGDELSDEQILSHAEAWEGKSTAAMKKHLKRRRVAFEAAGGRGVDLADEIDSLRVALAVRAATKGAAR